MSVAPALLVRRWTELALSGGAVLSAAVAIAVGANYRTGVRGPT